MGVWRKLFEPRQSLLKPSGPLTRGQFIWAFHDDVEIGPKMLARIAKHTGLRPKDL